MGKIYCTECGAELDESVKFCSSCGASLESSEVAHNQSNDFIQSFEIMPIIVYLIVSIVGVYILNSLYLIYPHIIIFITLSAMIIGFLSHNEIKFVMIYSLIAGVIFGFIMEFIIQDGTGLSGVMVAILLTMLGSFLGHLIKIKLNY